MARIPPRLLALWGVVGAALIGLCVLLAWASPRFGYDVLVRDMPVLRLTAGLVLAGLIFLALAWLIPATLRGGQHRPAVVLAWVVLVGLAMRAVLFASEPALEDDYQRYLWDGAITAHGLNPYATSPADAKRADPDKATIGRLAAESGLLIGRVNHPELRTLYPPVAQAMFALAHWIEPWSLKAWRGVILAFDMATAGLLVVALAALGRSPLWAALYWWNPLAVKELVNSAHMEAMVAGFLMAALVLALRRRPLWATACIALAAGAKIWPALLFPLVWRPLLSEPRKLIAAVAIAAGAAMACAYPMLSAGLDQSSGLVAYAEEWRTNNALMPGLETIADRALAALGVEWITPAIAVRAALGLMLGMLVLWLVRHPHEDERDLAGRWLIVTGAMFLVSPAQFPWYFLWILPLLAITPVFGLLLATATLPLYYLAFHFMSRGEHALFPDTIVWLVWVPVWAFLILEALPLARRGRLRDTDASAKG